MNLTLVEKIADALLYEGYILYPYRPSAVKNQQRWNFGALCPQRFSDEQGGTEAWRMQTECILQGSLHATLDVKIRFLHLLTREVGRPIAGCQVPLADWGDAECQMPASDFCFVPSLEINGQLFQSWQESVEREVVLPNLNLSEVGSQPHRTMFAFPPSRQFEPLCDAATGEVVAVIMRTQQEIQGAVEVVVRDLGERAFKIRVRILNRTQCEDAAVRSRDDALMRSFVSTHTILNVQEGEFVSLLDPPETVREAAAGCSNIGTYPVLVGKEGERDCMLSSPIILYDYPQIAPESAGALFDGTEIDEILTLRIMALTDEEKREMRSADELARQILERTETLAPEQLMKMHGAMKGVDPES